jgi:two-component system, chemotaxis family, chemotaxis protein CheY
MNMKIVIADDSRTARFLIRQYLEMAGFFQADFIEVESGREALDHLKENAVDLVITDYKMPEMDGLDLLRRVKASPKLHDLPVLVITSFANQAKIDELLENGAFAVLQKPLSLSKLHETVKTFLNSEEYGE